MKFSNKLSFAILITGMIVLILLSFSVYRLNYNSIMKSQLTYTKSIANEVSENIDQLLHEKINTVLTLTSIPIIKESLETSNLIYADMSDDKKKEAIKLLNERWKSTKDPTDNFILKFTDNKVSHFLKDQQVILKGEYGEIFLTNKFGALVASTSKLSTFAHGHKYWWLGSYNKGEGAIFFDDRGYDDSVGGYVLGLVVPVRKGTEIIGILKCNLNILGGVSKLISGVKDKSIGKFKLTRSGGMIVLEEGFKPLSTQVHDSIFKKLKSNNHESFIVNDSEENYLVGFSEIGLTKGEKGYGFGGTFESIDHKKGNTGETWYVICYRQMSVVLAPITKSMKAIIFIGAAIILILVIVSQVFAREIAKPLTILDKATEKIGKGDFKYRIDTKRNDEFGNLSHSFNNMASQLQHTTTSVKLLEDEVKYRKQIEEALRKSEEKYRLVIENIVHGIQEVDTSGKIIFANSAYHRMLGYENGELIGRSMYNTVSDDFDQKDLGDYLQNLVQQQPKPEPWFSKAVKKDGATLDTQTDWDYKRNRQGEVTGFISIISDITERKQVEEALRESEEKYRSIMESTKDEAYICSSDFRIQYMNSATVTRIGLDATGELCHKAIYGLDEECSWCIFDKVLQGENVQYELLNPNNNRSYSISNSPIWHTDGAISKLTVCRDITDLKKIELQLQQAQKVKAIATLAGGIAHQFNNALSPISINLDMLETDYPGDKKIDNYTKQMKDSTIRMALLSDQLLAYARGGKYQESILPVSNFTRDTLSLIRHTIDPDIQIETDIPHNIFSIKADLTQMQMVLSAILTNASEAIEGKGRIRIVCRNKTITDETITDFHNSKPGDYVRLMIEDNGKGMDEETRSRIFEPFFTTKFQGRGLGMASVYGIIKNHDGWTLVDSELDEGTAVHIYLPAVDPPVKEPKKPKIEPVMIKGTATILVIEDEEMVMDVTRKILERMGYHVLEAKTGKEAINVAKTFDGGIDLAMLDIILPDMSGNVIYPSLMETRPNLKVIVFSGYSIDGPAQEILDAGAEDFIKKPFSIAELSEKLNKILEGK